MVQRPQIPVKEVKNLKPFTLWFATSKSTPKNTLLKYREFAGKSLNFHNFSRFPSTRKMGKNRTAAIYINFVPFTCSFKATYRVKPSRMAENRSNLKFHLLTLFSSYNQILPKETQTGYS